MCTLHMGIFVVPSETIDFVRKKYDFLAKNSLSSQICVHVYMYLALVSFLRSHNLLVVLFSAPHKFVNTYINRIHHICSYLFTSATQINYVWLFYRVRFTALFGSFNIHTQICSTILALLVWERIVLFKI